MSALLALTYSCTNSGKMKSQNDSLSDTNKTEVQNRRCYLAIDGKDTAYLNIQTSSGGKVMGDMMIKYAEEPKNEGTLKGEFKGDTLFADYTFTTGDNKEKVNKNPLAFLKEGSKLTLGIGVIETYLGRSYFAKDKPINFERGRFKFNATDCK